MTVLPARLVRMIMLDILRQQRWFVLSPNTRVSPGKALLYCVYAAQPHLIGFIKGDLFTQATAHYYQRVSLNSDAVSWTLKRCLSSPRESTPTHAHIGIHSGRRRERGRERETQQQTHAPDVGDTRYRPGACVGSSRHRPRLPAFPRPYPSIPEHTAGCMIRGVTTFRRQGWWFLLLSTFAQNPQNTQSGSRSPTTPESPVALAKNTKTVQLTSDLNNNSTGMLTNASPCRSIPIDA